MTNYGKHFSTLKTPQTEKAREDQVKNNAGGFVFQLDCWARLDRWLILGADGPTYYASEKALVKDNAQAILDCLAKDGIRTINRIVEMSETGRAPKNDTCIFALAMAAGDSNPATRKAALDALPKVCRIGTHLFHFTRDVENFRKWGRGLRTAVANWYLNKPVDKMAYDVVKYQQRDGWSHRDVLRLSHAVAKTPEQDAVFRYVVAGTDGFVDREVKRRLSDKTERVEKYGLVKEEHVPKIIQGFEMAKKELAPKKIVSLIQGYGLTREMLPTQSLNSPEVWEALLEKMPMTAMIRNLGKMTAVGLLKPLSAASRKVVEALVDKAVLKRARIHPIAVLVALRTYQQGKGDKGKLTWNTVPQIIDALDTAFYDCFDNVEPTGKNIMLAHDISGSMSGGVIAGCPGVTPIVASAAMAMVTAKVEKNWHAVGFTAAGGDFYASRRNKAQDSSQCFPGLTELKFSPKQRLDDVCNYMLSLPMGMTDCSLPMVYAKEKKLEIDAFYVYTDNETYQGEIHAYQALRNYRQASGRNAKLIVVGMTSTGFTIADPSDAEMLDVVGFDPAAPSIMSQFISDKPTSQNTTQEDCA